MNKNDLGKLERYAQRAMEVQDDERKQTILRNLQQKIVEAIGNVISACEDLIDENTTLRVGSYQQYTFKTLLNGEAMKSIRLLKYALKDVLTYERDSAGMKAVRERRWQQWKNDPMEKPTPKEIESNGFVSERNAPDPNNIYRVNGSYTRWRELREKFEYRLCRRIRECGGGDLETLFKAVCLYIALGNETKEGAEFLALSEAKTPHETEPRDEPRQQYTQGLLSLFHNHTELIEELEGLSDDEILFKITQMAKLPDKFGKPLIENPQNYGNKTKFAEALKENGLIKMSVGQFRQRL